MDDGLETVVSGELTKFETPNTVVYGILKNYKVQKTPKGEGHVYEVETKNGIAAFFAPTLLQDKLKEIEIGRMVKITYLGMKKGNSGNEYKTFEVKNGPVNTATLAAAGITLKDGLEDTGTL